MPTAPDKQCDTPACKSVAIAGSIYCAAHQTKHSKGNRVRHRPVRKAGPLFVSCVNQAAVDKALAADENLDDIEITPPRK
jgi:hypothetical protein